MLPRLLLPTLLCATFCSALGATRPPLDCKVSFQVVYLDRLQNLETGIPNDSRKDVDKRLSKYGDVCWAGEGKKGDLVFFIHTVPAVYNGHRIYTNQSNSSAAASAGDSAAASSASSTSTTAVPYSVDYSVFYLDVELPTSDDKFKVLHTVDQKGLYNTLYGIGYGKGKHPIPNVIDAAASWVHSAYLGGETKGKW